MFNRNARNRLNSMGGIRSLANGGLTMGTNPMTKFGNINQGVLNQLISPNKTVPQIKSELQQQIKEPFINRFLPDTKFVPSQPARTEGEAFTQGILGAGQKLLSTILPKFEKAPVSPVDVSREKMKRLTPFGMQEKAKEALDAGIMTLPSNMLTQDPTKTFYKDKIVRDLEKEIERTREPEGTGDVDADEEFAIDDRKKIIKPTEGQQKTIDDQKKVLDDQKRKLEGQLGDIKDTSKDDINKLINTGTKEEQQAELKQLMQEFSQNAPKYEGMDKGLAIAKIGFAMAAGQSPDALTNIAKALEGGADMFIKDKRERDAFNRQVQLSALQYGLGEIGKKKAFERQKALSVFNKQFDFEKYVVGPEGFTDEKGNTYAEGDEVTISKAFLAEKGTPPGLTSTTMAKALLDKQLAYTKALNKVKENMTVKDISKTDKFIEKYSKATTGMLEATNGIKLTQGFMLDVVGNKVTGFKPAFQSLWSRASAVLGSDAPKSYTDRDVAVADMKKVFQKLIPLTLGRDQSANSISDRDVAFLADAFVTEQVMKGGVGALVAMPKEILLDKSRKIIDRFESAQIENSSKLNAYDLEAKEFILPSGKSIGTLVAGEKKRLGKDLPTFKAGQKYTRGEDGVIRISSVKDQ